MPKDTKSSSSTDKNKLGPKPTSRSAGKIIAFHSTETKQEPGRENKDIDQQQSEWVPFFKGSDNIYVNDLARRYRRSPTHAAIIDSKTNYTLGDGFAFFDESGEAKEFDKIDESTRGFFKDMNLDGESLWDVYREAAFNWIWSGNVYFEISRAEEDGEAGFNVKVIDSSKCRIDEKEEVCFISSFWRDIRSSVKNETRHTVDTVDLWDGDLETTQEKFVIHIKRKVPEFDFYGLPDYIAALKDIDIEWQVDDYNYNRLEEGFFPSIHVTHIGEPPNGMTGKEYVKDMKKNFAGHTKAGKGFFQIVDNKDQRAIIHEFEGEREGEFMRLEESAFKGTVRAHRWFPQLAGIETSGKLGSNQELINMWRIVMNGVVRPGYQKPINRLFGTVFQILDIGLQLKIINSPPVGNEDIADTGVLLANELRAERGLEPLEELEKTFVQTSSRQQGNGQNN